MKIVFTRTLVEKLEIVLAAAYNYADVDLVDPEFYEEVVDAHTTWAKICEDAGGEVNYIEEE